MRKVVILLVFTLFLASVMLFNLFGSELRDLLSPEVEIVMTGYRSFTDSSRAYLSFPKEALLHDESGSYVWAVESTDEYPESAYIVRRTDVEAVYEDEKYAYVMVTDGGIINSVVMRWGGVLENGCRIRLK